MENYELIEQYINNELSASEKAEFEAALASDKNLAENYTIYKSINSEMKMDFENKEASFRENLMPLQEQYFNETKTASTVSIQKEGKVRRLIFTALSAAAVLAIIFVLLKPSGKSTSTEELYAAYAIHDKVENTVRGNAMDAAIKNATELYNKKEYAAAIPALKQIVDSTGQLSTMLAISYMETNDTKNAESIFTTLNKGTTIYAEKASWYLALVHLKNKDKEKCKQQLSTMPNTSSYYDKAQELLKKL